MSVYIIHFENGAILEFFRLGFFVFVLGIFSTLKRILSDSILILKVYHFGKKIQPTISVGKWRKEIGTLFISS